MQRRIQTERGRSPKSEIKAETNERERFTARVNSSNLSLKAGGVNTGREKEEEDRPSLGVGVGIGGVERGVGGREGKE